MAFPADPSTKPPLASKILSFPVEIIRHIIYYLDPIELMRLQTISKQFHAIINDPMLWKTLYKEARCARFPGPFPWQSTRFLQRTLVRSTKVEQTWTSQPFKVRASSRRQILCDLDYSCDHEWVGHRWFIFGRESDTSELVSRDIDTGSEQTLWNIGLVSDWTTCSIISFKGHMIYVVLRIGDGDQHDAVKLLEFRADDDSGYLAGPTVFDVPATYLVGEPFVRCISVPDAPFLHISVVSCDDVEHAVVFDVRSQIFYKFPRFTSEVEEVQQFLEPYSPYDIEVLLTTTHIIVISQFDLDEQDAHLVQAFVIPDSPTPDNKGVCELRLCHEEGGDGYWSPGFHLIRNSVVNSVNGSTTLRFMYVEWPSEHFELSCTEFSLPQSQTDGTPSIPLEMDTEEILKVRRPTNGGHEYHQAEDSGIVRGFFVVTSPNRIPARWDPDHAVLYKFVVDATGERCVAAHSGPTSVVGLDGFYPLVSVIWFDGVRGRVCYGKGLASRYQPSEVFVAELE